MFKKYFFVAISLLFIIIFLMSVSFIGCSDQVATPDNQNGTPTQLSVAEQQISNSAGSFGFKIFNKICESQADSNIFISPLSISMALGMTLNGAAGETYSAMQQALELQGLSQDEINNSYKNLINILRNTDSQVDFHIANSIWYRDELTFDNNFIQTNIDYFDAAVRAMNFNDPGTVNTINNWIKNNTDYKIEEVIKSISPTTVMFLINALYFNGTWKYEFNPENTTDDLFDLGNNNYAACKLMTQKREYSYFENDAYQSINLPYGNEKFSMSIFLPKDEILFAEEFSQMNNDRWQQTIERFTTKEVTLMMPKFKLGYEIELKDVLSQLGMEVAFTDAANFRNMFAPGGIFISKVKHKACVEVNEEGTEASAVTVVEIELTSIRDEIIMRLNRPFVFVIHEKDTGAILFMGRVNNPINEEG